MTAYQTDLAVIGGGAAGLAAAREARRRGATALIVNRGPLGGDCTFTGCVPSKTVIEAARAGASFSEAFERARNVVAHIASTENSAVLVGEGIEVLDAEAALLGPGLISADGKQIKARGVVVALGSRPAVPPIPGLAEANPMTSDNLWELTDAPASLIVVGGGAIGCELSQALAGLGVAVTLIELASRLLPLDEAQASAVVEQALSSAGVKILTGVGVERVEPDGAAHRVVLSDGSQESAEQILVAVGRKPNSDRGGLADGGLELDRRGYVVNSDDLATNLAQTYVAGDISGRIQLTHAADHMGRLAAGNILRRAGKAKFRAEQIPRVTFTNPEVAAIGLSEAEAAEQVKGARVAELPLTEHDRAIAAGATSGYLKLIAAPRKVVGDIGGGRLVGATVVAERAGELMGELALALTLKVFVGRMALTVHPYPTWSYAIPKVTAQFFTEVEGRTARPARAEG